MGAWSPWDGLGCLWCPGCCRPGPRQSQPLPPQTLRRLDYLGRRSPDPAIDQELKFSFEELVIFGKEGVKFVPPGKVEPADELLKLFEAWARSLIRPTRTEGGCHGGRLACQVTNDSSDRWLARGSHTCELRETERGHSQCRRADLGGRRGSCWASDGTIHHRELMARDRQACAPSAGNYYFAQHPMDPRLRSGRPHSRGSGGPEKTIHPLERSFECVPTVLHSSAPE